MGGFESKAVVDDYRTGADECLARVTGVPEIGASIRAAERSVAAAAAAVAWCMRGFVRPMRREVFHWCQPLLQGHLHVPKSLVLAMPTIMNPAPGLAWRCCCLRFACCKH